MNQRLYLTRDGRIVARPASRDVFAGSDFGDDDGLGDDDDLGDDETGDDDLDGDFDGDFDGDDETGDDDDLGARKRRRAKRGSKRRPGVGWAKTALVGTTGSISAAATVTIRPQFNFKASDIAITSSSASSTASVTSVLFGDRTIWSNSTGLPISILGPTSFLRNLIKGSRIRGGLDIAVAITPGGTETVTVSVIGFKQTTGRCSR